MSSKEKNCKCLETALWVAFYCAFIYVGISATQVFKDISYYCATSSLLLIVMIKRRLKVFSWYNLSILAVYGVASLYWLYVHRFDWGYQYATLLALRFMMYGFFLLIVLDIIITGKKTELQLNKPVFAVIAFVAFAVAIIFGLENTLIVICPVLAWYFTPMKKEQWNCTMLNIAVAAYVSFLVLMTASLIIAPTYYEYGRYVGIFVFPAAGGLLATIAIIAVIYHWQTLGKTFADKKKNNLIHVLLLVYPVIASLLTFDRAAWLGLMCVLLAVYIFKRDDKRIIKRRSIISGALVLALAIVFCLSLKILISTNMDYIGMTINENGEAVYGDNAFWANIINKALIKGSKTGVFPENTVLNAIDGFSSARLGIWYTGLKQVKLIGPTELSMTLPNGEFMGHVHNTYIDWCMRYGFLGGVPVIIWFFAFFAKVVKLKISGDESVYYPLLWLAFCFGFFIVEREVWNNLPPFLLLLMMHPLLIKFSEDRKED